MALRGLRMAIVLAVAGMIGAGTGAAETGAQASRPLVMVVHPYLPASELVRRFEPLAKAIAAKVGEPVVLRISPSYQEHVDIIGRGEADFAFIGPAAYVRLVDDYGPRPVLGRIVINGSPLLLGSIVVRADSPMSALSELTGRTFAFGSANSTMSHIVPRHVLAEAGVGLDRLDGHAFLGSHVNVALAVLMGRFDAGAVKEEVFAEFEARGLRRLAALPPMPEHLFVADNALDPVRIVRLRHALWGLGDDAEGRAVLALIADGVDGIMSAKDADYDALRTILRAAEPEGR